MLIPWSSDVKHVIDKDRAVSTVIVTVAVEQDTCFRVSRLVMMIDRRAEDRVSLHIVTENEVTRITTFRHDIEARIHKDAVTKSSTVICAELGVDYFSLRVT